MLRCDAKLPGNMVANQLFEKCICGGCAVRQKIVIANAGADKHFFDPRNCFYGAQQFQIFAVFRTQCGARRWRQAVPVFADALRTLLVTGRTAKVCSRSADIVNIPFEIR